MSNTKAAVIGLGRMGAEPSSRFEGKIPNGWLPISHVEAIQSTPGLELIALCDQDDTKVERFKSHYQIDYGFTDYRKLIDELHPEFLSIATRTAIRPEIIHYAAAAGVKMIYAEKPLCTGLLVCDELIAKMKSAGIYFAYGVNRRYHELYRKAKDLIQEGVIGDLKEIVIENGYSNLLWTHPHSTDLILFFANTTQLTRIHGNCTFNNPPESKNFVDDDPLINHAYFEFANGIQGVISKVGGTNVRLGGTMGTLTIHGDGKYIEINKGVNYFYEREIIEMDESKSATQNAMKELLGAYTNQSAAPISFDEVRVGFMMLMGVVQSSMENGLLITPEEINLDLTVTGRIGNLFA